MTDNATDGHRYIESALAKELNAARIKADRQSESLVNNAAEHDKIREDLGETEDRVEEIARELELLKDRMTGMQAGLEWGDSFIFGIVVFLVILYFAVIAIIVSLVT